jgi:hypothetical protein
MQVSVEPLHVRNDAFHTDFLSTLGMLSPTTFAFVNTRKVKSGPLKHPGDGEEDDRKRAYHCC